MQRRPYGKIDGNPVTEYTLTNANGLILKVLDYGCTVTELHVPDRDGNLVDVVLGSADLKAYQTDSPYFGTMVGRCANRIANASFELDGTTYTLAKNNGEHSLHGGAIGIDKAIWTTNPVGENRIEFTHRSPDGDEGYPGNLDINVVMSLTDENEFRVETTATTDAPTVCNIAHHGYWNLEGHDAGKHLDHEVQLHCGHYTPVDETLIPTGEIATVANTPLDFQTPKRIGEDIGNLGAEPPGFDHNFVIDGPPGNLRPVAMVRAPKSGIVMHLQSDAPGVQFYTGNFMDGHAGKNGANYGQHDGFCLETQHFPDGINKEGIEGWPSVVLRPGDTYRHLMVHRFTTS